MIHDPERGDQTEAAYRMAWARTWLKKAGFLENSSRGVWALTPKGREEDVYPEQVLEHVRAAYAERRAAANAPSEPPGAVLDAAVILDADEPDAPADWRGRLMRRLQRLAPDAFERLCQRVRTSRERVRRGARHWSLWRWWDRRHRHPTYATRCQLSGAISVQEVPRHGRLKRRSGTFGARWLGGPTRASS